MILGKKNDAEILIFVALFPYHNLSDNAKDDKK